MEPVQEIYRLDKTLESPAHIASLAFGHAGHLFAGSDDGSFRVYDLSSYKVIKAVRALGAEVSSIVCVKKPGSELRDAWIAHGQKVSRFQMESPKMIQTLEDALVTVEVGETGDDILNELALNANKSHLAFTMDSGVVGVIDLSDNSITKMETKHENISATVKFVPDRPRELVSGGYDTVLLHFDWAQAKVLSRRQMEPYVVDGSMALAPPFIMSMAMSSTGVLAAGTADGHLWIGFGGEKGSASKKKAKKWEGLDENKALLIKVAEGPIVAVAFSDPRKLAISTLMGVITNYQINYDEEAGSVVLQQLWQHESTGVEKVNALLADDKRIIIGGIGKKGRGIIEIWKQEVPATSEAALQASS
ncbi:WD40 repeat-like protein [Pholiota conissans]|uniref:WD40 repeat-like protein n=1 Tax=Pholiota conissans TaxID=109636 RepID=A0A9P6D144_9AGAR|nr:WD40 repeat-like protein [Pholiota conissans]